MKTQKTLTINGNKITPPKLRKAPCEYANGGHNISNVHGLEIHWMDWGDDIHIFNAGSVRTNEPFGAKAYALQN